ncbi:MAG TPA: BPL-N domain-containing protein, partial [Bacillota bacterium]|nr:BPL-N domain-containing protein [Bacillota bacterium]HPT34872.1 BPL-N domain-containing protein [Bacillota bacterium]HQD06217.1 BPL-N domain-containing protein [Bacillota bacterium]
AKRKMKKRLLLAIICLAAIVAAFGIGKLAEPIFSRPVENDPEEGFAGPDKLLLVMIPLSGDYLQELSSGLEGELKGSSWLPEGLTQGKPPGRLEQFQLPAQFYEAEGLVSSSINRLTLDLAGAPAALSGDELKQLLAEDEGGFYYLWLPLKEVQGDDSRASFLLDPEPAAAGAADQSAVSSLRGNLNESRGCELVVARIKEEVFDPRVGLYTGKGTWEANVEALANFLDYYGIRWQGFDENDILEMDLQANFDLLWFPGGFSAEYKYNIPDHGKIREFVRNGGKYIGICAGAYYAADVMVWKGENSDYPLDLFPGRGIGPMSRYVSWGEKTAIRLEGSHPANNEFSEPSLEMFYFDGPYFAPFEELGDQVQVLARYDVNGEPAAVAAAQGRGKALLLGMHPELGYAPPSGRVNTHGGEGARWDWLYAVLRWLVQG